MNYKEKLDTLYVSSKVDAKLYNKVKDLDLIFDTASTSSISELSNFIKRYIDKYKFGSKISKKFWGIRGYKQLQQSLYDKIKQQLTRQKPTSILQLYDDLQDDVKKTDKTLYDFGRVARTEGKAMTIVFQLETAKQAGYKYVRYETRGDSKVRPKHQSFNGREFEIDYLLSEQGEHERIPMDPNCRCRYTPIMRGL